MKRDTQAHKDLLSFIMMEELQLCAKGDETQLEIDIRKYVAFLSEEEAKKELEQLTKLQ